MVSHKSSGASTAARVAASTSGAGGFGWKGLLMTGLNVKVNFQSDASVSGATTFFYMPALSLTSCFPMAVVFAT